MLLYELWLDCMYTIVTWIRDASTTTTNDHAILVLLFISPHTLAIECGDPGTPQNGSRQLSGETAGSVVTYRCDTGFDLVGASTQRCMDSGDWSDQLPECRGKQRSDLTSVVFGHTCIV